MSIGFSQKAARFVVSTRGALISLFLSLAGQRNTCEVLVRVPRTCFFACGQLLCQPEHQSSDLAICIL